MRPQSLVAYKGSSDNIPIEVILKHLGRDEYLPAYEAIAEALFPGCTKYLRDYQIIWIVRSDLTESDTLSLIDLYKSITQRASYIFPSIFSVCDAQNDRECAILLNKFFDCLDTLTSLENRKQERVEKRIKIENLSELKNRISLLKKSILLVEDDITPTLDEIQDREMNTSLAGYTQTGILRILGQLENLHAAAEIYEYELQNRVEESVSISKIFFNHNRIKTVIVEEAYENFLWTGRPRFVTTPNSDFSLLCSLIYEIATGRPDESFSGAIADFSKSQSKAIKDQEEIEYSMRYGGEAETKGDADNFFLHHLDIEYRIKKARYVLGLANLEVFSEKTRLILQKCSEKIMDQVSFMQKQHGPFILWASQMSESHRIFDHSEINAINFQTNIMTGESRRRQRLMQKSALSQDSA